MRDPQRPADIYQERADEIAEENAAIAQARTERERELVRVYVSQLREIINEADMNGDKLFCDPDDARGWLDEIAGL